MYIDLLKLKGGCLGFSHLTESKNTYITEIYMKTQYKSLITNHKITHKKKKNDGVLLKGYMYVASKDSFRFCAGNKKKKNIVGISSD